MKTIDFKGKTILFQRIKGVYWISIKSVCEALNINYNRQFQNIKEDSILGAVFAIQQMQVPNDQARNMACLPEKFIYGWIFSINSKSEELQLYKRECYEILYNHFHGVITHRAELYSELSKERKKAMELEGKLKSNPEFMKLEESKMKIMRLWKNIKSTSGNDMELFNEEDF